MLKLATQNVGAVGALGALLFAPAGTVAWPQAWVFLALYFASGQMIGHWLPWHAAPVAYIALSSAMLRVPTAFRSKIRACFAAT